MGHEQHRADDAAHRRGTIIVNPGGPGLPAIATLRASAASYPQALRARFDLVTFDPRGVGETAPIRCGDDLDPLFDQELSPRSRLERNALLDAATYVATLCASSSGRMLGHVSTEETARDLERVRVALGTLSQASGTQTIQFAVTIN